MILPTWAVVSLSLSLSPQILPKSTYLSQRTVMNGKQDFLKQPEANTDLLYFSALSYYKSSVETNFPILLSHFRIRIVVLTCPDNKSARNHQPKSCVPEKSHKNHNDARPILCQLKSSRPFSLFMFVLRLESTTTKSLRHLHCRGSPLFKSRR